MFPHVISRAGTRATTSVPHTAPAEVKQSPIIYYTFLLIGASLLVFVLHKLDGILLPLFFAALLSVLLLPLVLRMEKWGWPPVLAIIAALLLMVLAISGLIVLFGTQLMELRTELPLLQQKLLVLFDQGQQWAHQKFGLDVMSKDELIATSMKSFKKSAGGYLGSTLSTTAGVLSVLTLVPIYIFCFLYYRDHMRQFMFRFVSPDKRTGVLQTLDNIQTVVQAYISGLLTVIVIVAVLNAIGLLVLDVKFAIFFAAFASVLAVIPYIGILVGATIPALVTLVETGSPARAAAVVGVFVFVQFLEGNFITPMVTGSKVSINPMAAIIALILGGELWGTAGMILSIPLVAVLKVVFDANKSLEPWGFLLGDISEMDESHLRRPMPQLGFFGKFWRMVKKM
ncbi:AI-2E family transporter [Hymenobacter sp. DH14]|uniref:AI-2E family transporter n=1 Tax=Hymenobacter cyanobacteriorum TaxID=2926463 RepID=A0A9X1VEL3_9BACT|nr:AI-2E family transporter [Hymenobacter cyanobacteriorum]MCI1187486.1 AI-2E family transporter [Hymenobacter cyanobacteriorum]